MKAFVVLLLLLVLVVFVLAGQSFQSRFLDNIYTPSFPMSAVVVPTSTSGTYEGGGAPRKVPTTTAATSSNPTGFRGPSGPPHIVGPSAPPPGN